jgi:hypothetical protein
MGADLIDRFERAFKQIVFEESLASFSSGLIQDMMKVV